MSSWVSCQSLWPHSHLSGHQDIKKSFCFLEESVVPWHWCSYSKSYNPYLREKISQFVIWSSWWKIFSQLWEVDVSFFWLVDCQNFVYIPQKFSDLYSYLHSVSPAFWRSLRKSSYLASRSPNTQISEGSVFNRQMYQLTNRLYGDGLLLLDIENDISKQRKFGPATDTKQRQIVFNFLSFNKNSKII